MIVRRLIVPLTWAATTLLAGQAFAQGTFPAPLPNACIRGFIALHQEAENLRKSIKAASKWYAPPDEACKLIGNYSQAEVKMIKYVEANWAECGIPQQLADQLKSGLKYTEAMKKRACAGAPFRGPVGEFPDLDAHRLN